MSEDCTGRHVCDTPEQPTAAAQWTCPDCDRAWYAFDVHESFADDPTHERTLRLTPVGTLGWTTAAPTDTTPPKC